ncbi:MAG: hypothetical protein ACLR8P_14330 [Clostridium fessum]
MGDDAGLETASDISILEMQQKTLALYLEELERAIEQLRREEPEKKRLCWGLGILGGLFLAVLLM